MLRPLHPDDLPALSSFHAETGGIRSVADGRARRPQRSLSALSPDTPKTASLSAVVLGDTGQFTGWADLWVPWFLPEILPAVEVGWPLGETLRHRRYATEAGRA